MLRSDAQQGEQLCASAALQSSQQPPGGPSPLDACQAMEAMSKAHQGTLLPRLEGYEAACARFCQRCLEGKVLPLCALESVSACHRRPRLC